jgi:putative transposase
MRTVNMNYYSTFIRVAPDCVVTEAIVPISKRAQKSIPQIEYECWRRVRTNSTNSNHAFPRHPNLVANLEISRPDQVWVADITYIRLSRGFIHLAVLMDVFTRAIRGWHLGRSLEQGLTLAALERALLLATPAIYHSDQGVQYAAAYVDRLRHKGVTLSMAAVGEPRENGFAERLMRTIKEEEVDLSEYRDFADAERNLGRFLDDVYNRKRIHSSLGYLTPREFENHWRQAQSQETSEETILQPEAPS